MTPTAEGAPEGSSGMAGPEAGQPGENEIAAGNLEVLCAHEAGQLRITGRLEGG